MPTSLLFVLLSLIWGSTWIAIDFQLGEVAAEISVAIRFSVAATLFGIYCLIKRKPLRFPVAVHCKMLAIGIVYYAIEYTLIYVAQNYLVSAVVALMSGSIIYINVFLRRIFLGKPIRKNVLVGATVGIAGMAMIFYPEFSNAELSAGIGLGIALAMLSFLCSGIGNILAENTLDGGISVLPLNFFTMAYGALALWIYAWITNVPFTLPSASSYYVSLAYLSLFGSVIAFSMYMQMIKKMGSDKSAYVVLIYPLVALLISTLFEDYQWQPVMYVGLPLVLIGNYVAMRK